MANMIYAFVRFFKTEAHRDSFLRGEIYMNRLRYFKKYEEEDACNIGDRHEGVSAWYQPDQIKLKIERPDTGEVILIDDFAGPVVLGLTRHEDYHVYCMSALYCDSEARFASLEELRSHVLLDTEKGDLGDYCSVIRGEEFVNRLHAALADEEKLGHLVGSGLVEYFDPDTFHGTFSGTRTFEEDQAIFRKKNCFSHQKEYRFYVYNRTSGTDPRVLKLGDLSDITVNCLKTELNKIIEVGFLEKDAEPV